MTGPRACPAIVLAAGRGRSLTADGTARPWLDIVGRPMVLRVVEALLASGVASDILVVGDVGVPPCTLPGGVCYLCAPGDMMATVLRAVEAAGEGEQLLFVTDDIPLITAEAIRAFTAGALAEDADAVYPLVAQEVILRNFPAAERTYIRLKEGCFTGGNLLLARRSIIPRCRGKAEEIFARRKDVLALAKWLGGSFLLRYAAGRLSVGDIERRASELVGIKGRAIISAYAEVGMDVDKESDLRIVEEIIRKSECGNRNE